MIDKLYVRRGDNVKRGELLATLKSGPERATLAVARARAGMQGDVDAAQAKVDLTEKKWQRAEELRKKNFICKNARDEAQEEYKLAVEQLRKVREKQHLAALEVETVDPVVDAASDTFGVRLRLPNPHDRVPPGIECRVRF